jgi:uncharacterized iron-regulated protein
MVRIISVLLVLLAACGGAAPRGAEAPAGVESAALPFKVLRARGGQEVPWGDFLTELGQADAVCIGESHSNPHDHWAQRRILTDALGGKGASTARALGLEMVQRPFQGVLDDYAAGRITDVEFLQRAGWKERWGFEWSFYRPMLTLARERGVTLLALNVEKELTRKVSRGGIDSLSPEDRASMPEMVLNDLDHRAWWEEIMGDMGGAHGHSQQKPGAEPDAEPESESESEPSPHAAMGDNIYAAQVLWDETMAERASKWLAEPGAPRRQIFILAGNGHCHESAMVRRIERRGVKAAVSIRPVVDDGEGNVATVLADPENDYLFVMTPSR